MQSQSQLLVSSLRPLSIQLFIVFTCITKENMVMTSSRVSYNRFEMRSRSYIDNIDACKLSFLRSTALVDDHISAHSNMTDLLAKVGHLVDTSSLFPHKIAHMADILCLID